MESAAEMFLKYDYAETKDLLKTFITLISATLVLSVTFSEKVVNFGKAGKPTKLLLFTYWALLIFSLIASGLGMAFIASAAGKILYGGIPILDFHYAHLALTAWAFTLLAGISYVSALIALAFSVARSILGKDTPHGL